LPLPEKQVGSQLATHVGEGLPVCERSLEARHAILEIEDHDGAYDRHCASCQCVLHRGHLCNSTVVFCLTCAVHGSRNFDPAISATCPYCLAVGRKSLSCVLVSPMVSLRMPTRRLLLVVLGI
jgi:hypothetical protein